VIHHKLSSGDKKSQGSSSIKHPSSLNGLPTDLKTPDKCDYAYNSAKTQDKFSHDKFQINSSSVEKFSLQKKSN